MRVHCDCHVWRQPMTWRKKKMRIIFRVWSPHWDRLCATNDNDTTRMHTAKPITIRISICTNIKSIIYLLSPGNIVRYHLVWRAYFYWITSSNRCKWIENLFARNAFNSNWTFAWSIDSAFSLQIALFRFSMLKYSLLLFFFLFIQIVCDAIIWPISIDEIATNFNAFFWNAFLSSAFFLTFQLLGFELIAKWQGLTKNKLEHGSILMHFGLHFLFRMLFFTPTKFIFYAKCECKHECKANNATCEHFNSKCGFSSTSATHERYRCIQLWSIIYLFSVSAWTFTTYQLIY